MKEKSIVELNWIRALAAVGVILYHYTTRYPELFSSNIVFGYQFSWGRAGVNTFFLLSGFLSLYNLNEHITGVAYIRKRVKKLYPEYWICMALTAITELLFLKAFFPGGAALAVNMTMLQGFLGIKNVDGAYWTLAYELRFYALIFFLMFIKKFVLLNGCQSPGCCCLYSIHLWILMEACGIWAKFLTLFVCRNFAHLFLPEFFCFIYSKNIKIGRAGLGSYVLYSFPSGCRTIVILLLCA